MGETIEGLAVPAEQREGFYAALALLLDEDAYLAWCDGRGEVPLTIPARRQLGDFLSVVGGDGTFYGSMAGKLEQIGDGTDWVAPSTAEPEDPKQGPMWHAVGDFEAGTFRSACGTAELEWFRGCRINELSPGVRRCAQQACQQRMTL